MLKVLNHIQKPAGIKINTSYLHKGFNLLDWRCTQRIHLSLVWLSLIQEENQMQSLKKTLNQINTNQTGLKHINQCHQRVALYSNSVKEAVILTREKKKQLQWTSTRVNWRKSFSIYFHLLKFNFLPASQKLRKLLDESQNIFKNQEKKRKFSCLDSILSINMTWMTQNLLQYKDCRSPGWVGVWRFLTLVAWPRKK